MKKLLLSLLILITFSANLFAQKPPPIEYGNIPLEDLQMKTYTKDSSAEAVILCDYGEYFYTFTDNYPTVNYRRHVRIKILKKSGFNQANIKIGYRVGRENYQNEIIRTIKATTYNLKSDGSIVKYDLDNKSIFDNKANQYLHYQIFTLPQIQEGSIIEYTYDLESGVWFNLRNWEFQKNIPVIWSELRANIPAYFDFNITLRSLIPLTFNEIEQGKKHQLRSDVEDKFLHYRFVMQKVEALKEEPYLTTIENFRSTLSFELAATYFPNQLKRDYSQTWKSLNETLITNENFGKQIKRFEQAETIAQLLKSENKDTLSLLTAAYKHIQKTMQWNEEQAFTTNNNLDKVYEKRIGNSAEINLMLIRLLRECGFDANPVLLSTRDNGEVSDLVLMDKFNYVVAHISLKDNDLLLDATDPLIPTGILPMRCLNKRGRLIVRKNSKWVVINTEPIRKKITIINMDILTDQSLKGTIRTSFAGHNASEFRTQVIKKGKANYLADYKKNRPNQTFESLQIFNLDTLENLAELAVKTTLNEVYSIAGDRLYFSPMLGEAEKSNPFQTKERKYPVDFGVPQEDNYIATFSIPKGYIVEEMPKIENITLPNNGGKFIFNCTLDGEQLKVNSKITLRKAIYTEAEYSTLREFYNRIVSKHAEQVVFKKK
ncbi:DUF3857 domain-containing protein [Arcicella sp. LKC2W]|uniref:DUF3857 domain-containing protein n=1 Tax=Arcicella sp. LKC2W TaxID=2984198 RepID=UPI002B20A719|nr:DUF3857 domain-containing protein [Arcicella sp. LKC2W]MEA5459360.1 DUF3857 domain-containing protein [Arcicella sp. LKC2W]